MLPMGNDRSWRPGDAAGPEAFDEAVRADALEISARQSGKHAASLSAGSPGVLHGNRTYLLQDDNGQILETHSISAGLDYPGVGPEHAHLKTGCGRIACAHRV